MSHRVYRIPHSTNVERVALALGLKGVRVQWVDVDPQDRTVVEAVSGQDLVPVLEAASGEVIADSMRIVAWLEAQAPEPALWPSDPAQRALTDIFVEWFNEVWKVAPNVIADERERLVPDAAIIAGKAEDLAAWLPWFEALLGERDFLLGDRVGAADVCAFPFLKYGVLAPAPEDDEDFHAVLHEHLPVAGRLPRLEAWIARMDALPRAGA